MKNLNEIFKYNKCIIDIWEKGMNVSKRIIILGIIIFLVGINIFPITGSIRTKLDISTENRILKLNFREDTEPPFTEIRFNGTEGNDNWFISDVNVSFYSTDNQSGVNMTYYAIDDSGGWTIYIRPFTVTESFIHLINYYSVDNAENMEDVKSAYFKIDQIQPDVWFAVEKIRCGKFLIYAGANDYESGMNKVEFYIDDILKSTVFEPPYFWIYTSFMEFALVKAYDKAGNARIPPVPPNNLNHLTGIISDVNITEDTVTFNAIFVLTHDGILTNKQITYPNRYVGYIGRFLMNAVFFP